ncbi:MAG: S9 family peptidase [Bacteroidota bacterium]
MNFRYHGLRLLTVCLVFVCQLASAQRGGLQWAKDGFQYYRLQGGNIVELDIRDAAKSSTVVTAAMLTPAGQAALAPRRFAFSADGQKVLLNTNTKRVWRYDTRGDYWVYDLQTKSLKKLGKGKPESSLMFAKFSPDGKKVAYVSEHNIYMEDLASGTIKPLTTSGTKKLINGTFDWAYEEEFDCRDGFRWSPDGRNIAYWQIDASKIKNYLMLNTTDSTYSFTVPVEYPVAGEDPSSCKVGVVDVATAKTKWMAVPGDPIQHYIPRMEWANNPNEIMLLQLNRPQNESRIFIGNISNGTTHVLHQESDKAWVDVRDAEGWTWIDHNKKFLWLSEKDGWNHIYTIDRDGKEQLITKGDYDVVSIEQVDEAGGLIYFIASPDNATQRYLYSVKIGGGPAVRVSPADQPGTHSYEISPNGKIAQHTFSNSYTPYAFEVISLPDHKHLSGTEIKVDPANKSKGPEFFKVKTVDGIEMDGWMVKPTNFDPNKKYPVVFMVYGEPASSTAPDSYGVGRNGEYVGNMANDGYIYMSLDNRGAPVPKGREWRKSIYKNIGLINIRDQAMAAKEIIKWPFVDSSRVAVWGWSGGGSSTLNLMFQYPEIYKTGIAVAAVGWQLSYDNIYQERYMGVPTDAAGREPFIKGSPVTYAKNLRGNLLYVHGTGDDNVHYKNAEMLINELIKYNKQFQVMPYPNRTHGISEGAGTSLHLRTLYTKYLKEHCPPGGR